MSDNITTWRLNFQNYDDANALLDWCNGHAVDDGIEISTPEGRCLVRDGDYIIKDDQNRFHLRKASMMPVRPGDIDHVMSLVRAELVRAVDKFGPIASPHEGYGVILEEVDEMWDEVKGNDREAAVAKAVQVAAMGARFVLDLGIIR